MSSTDKNPAAEDRALLEAYQQTGDKQYLAQLYTRYTHLVLGVCLKYLKNREESEDAVMQLYEKLQHDLLEKEVREFAPWLYRVTQNHCLMQLRKAKSLEKKHGDFEKDLQQDVENEAWQHHQTEDVKNLQLEKLPEAMGQLPPEQKQCLELFFFEEKSYQEVSDTTGYSLKEVKSYLQNGKRNLKKLLGQIAICLLAFYQYLQP